MAGHDADMLGSGYTVPLTKVTMWALFILPGRVTTRVRLGWTNPNSQNVLVRNLAGNQLENRYLKSNYELL